MSYGMLDPLSCYMVVDVDQLPNKRNICTVTAALLLLLSSIITKSIPTMSSGNIDVACV